MSSDVLRSRMNLVLGRYQGTFRSTDLTPHKSDRVLDVVVVNRAIAGGALRASVAVCVLAKQKDVPFSLRTVTSRAVTTVDNANV